MGLGATAAIMLTVTLAAPAAGCAGSRAATATGTASMPATASEPGSSTRTPAAVTQLCGPPDAPGRLTTIRAADGVRLAAVEAGAGERGVVLIPELGRRGKCGWWNFAAYLAANGYHVLLFDHRCTGESACASGPAESDLMSDIRGAVSRLRQEGAARVALVGGESSRWRVSCSSPRVPRAAKHPVRHLRQHRTRLVRVPLDQAPLARAGPRPLASTVASPQLAGPSRQCPTPAAIP